MANEEVQQSLLPKSTETSNENNDYNGRIQPHSSTIPPPDEAINVQMLPQSIFTDKLSLRQILVFLTAYLGLGSVCFFLVGDQIKGQKTNPILDAIYFCVVTMTTVGYGDLVPDSVFSKLLACIFVFTGMALVGFILSKAVDYMVEKEEVLLVKAIHMHENKFGPNEILKEVEMNRAKYKFFTALALVFAFIIIGIIFLTQVEKLNAFDALYCVCTTITTLGYGDKSFSTIGGRCFAVFWIVISTICLAQSFLYLAELHAERKQRSLVKRVLTRKITLSDLEAADLDNDKVVSAAEFILYTLEAMGKISKEDISTVMEKFRKLDVDHSGTLTEADLVPSSQSSQQAKG